MKLWTQEHVLVSTPRSARIATVVAGLRWSKKREISRRRTPPIFPLRMVISALKRRRVAASGAEWYFLEPNCMGPMRE
jgi:hypothetical protein